MYVLVLEKYVIKYKLNTNLFYKLYSREKEVESVKRKVDDEKQELQLSIDRYIHMSISFPTRHQLFCPYISDTISTDVRIVLGTVFSYLSIMLTKLGWKTVR